MTIICYGDDPFASFTWELSLSIHEIAISLFSLPSYSSTQLVELSESEIFGVEDDDRICREEVHTIFYDRRREEDIVFSFFEIMYAFFDVVPIHPTVGRDDSHLFPYDRF